MMYLRVTVKRLREDRKLKESIKTQGTENLRKIVKWKKIKMLDGMEFADFS